MRRIAKILCVFLAVALLASCNGKGQSTPAPTPKPDPIADMDPESGTLGALAFAMTNALGMPISAGEDANEPAVGIGAAKLAVTALGLDLELRMMSMGLPPSDADYLNLALEYEVAPDSLFTSEAMTAQQIDAFAKAVADARERNIGFNADSRTWTPAELSTNAEAALRVAVLSYNPLAQGRGVFRYGIESGNVDSISYWSLAALGGARADVGAADDLAFVTVNDQTNAKLGTISIDNDDLSAVLREAWGLTLPVQTPGLTKASGRLYLSAPVDDIVRQYPIAYRVERSGDLLRIRADVLNYVVPVQYAGKVVVILRENADTLLGWQIASIEADTTPLPQIYAVDAQATAQGYSALSLIDDNMKTVWQIGNADAGSAKITFTFQQPTTITGIGIYNGDHSGDTATLQRYASAGTVGIRFSKDAEKDDMRIDLNANIEEPVAGREIVQLFGREITTDTIVLVFYGNTDGYLRLSGVRVF